MVIGIDISQTAYRGTGVSNYLENLIDNLLEIDKSNEYVLFFSSLRRNSDFIKKKYKNNSNVSIKTLKFPPSLLNIIWNRFHIFPIDMFLKNLDLFITSDWTEPPVRNAKKGTIIYDLIVYKSHEETHDRIVSVQKNKLSWVKKESDFIITISESSKKDIQEILKIDSSKIHVVYPGI